jgi:hypothetical protein
MLAQPVMIGVFPGAELKARPRLFRAVEEATGARFAAWPDATGGRVAGVVFFTRAEPPPGIRSIVATPGDGPPAASARVSLARDGGLDRRLRGRVLRDDEVVGIATLTSERGDTVLASTAEGAALWTRAGLVDRVVVSPRELAPGEVLRDVLANGRFLSLLPLVHLLRELDPGPRWSSPPLRASFVFDDPNLRRPSYGFIRYAELARHAERHGYHAAMATIPLDARALSTEAAAFFRGDRPLLSLLVHGNDHLSRELARPLSNDEALALAAQALRRIEQLERRAHVPVARVMVPPHGALAEGMARALFRTGYEAVCTNIPYPWLDRPPADRLLAGWDVAELVVGGLPMIPRFRLRERDDLALRAYLGQPLVLYGHSEDLAEGYDVLAEAADDVNAVGDVEWTSPQAIAQGNYLVQEQGESTNVRLFTRRAHVLLPEGTRRLLVDLPASADGLEEIVIAPKGERGQPVAVGESVDVAGQRVVDIRLTRRDAASPLFVPPPRGRPWPVLRRTLTEARDRALPRLPRRALAVLRRPASSVRS